MNKSTIRNGNTIVYATKDAERFHLPESDMVDVALNMSDRFLAVATGLGQRAVELQSSGDVNLTSLHEANVLARNASEFSRFAGAVRSLCPAELEARRLEAVAELEATL